MSKFINMIALAAFACATVPTHALAEPTSEQTAAAPKKKSGFLSFAKRVAEQVAPQVLPQNGSLKSIAGQVALSAVQQSDDGESDHAVTNGCGLDAASRAAMSMRGQGGSAAPNAQAQAALSSMAAMMKSRGDRSMTAAANAMMGGAPTC
jgi:hypothetical protein